MGTKDVLDRWKKEGYRRTLTAVCADCGVSHAEVRKLNQKRTVDAVADRDQTYQRLGLTDKTKVTAVFGKVC